MTSRGGGLSVSLPSDVGGPLRSARKTIASRLSARLLAVGAVWLLLAGASFLRVPIPGINEPHYLAKAKAYWNPAWCAGDLFLESSSPHRAFYLSIGWLTQFLTLEETAIVGRCAALAVVAWGWSHLTGALGFSLHRSLAAMIALLLLQMLGSWSGEWLVGGVESKVFAYGLAFAGLGALLTERTTAAGVWLGLATTAHPLVGGWAMLVAALSTVLAPRAADRQPSPSRWRQVVVMSLWWFVAAAPGIAWALPALRSGGGEIARAADYIQVSYRLAHHLDPWTFPRQDHRFFACLIALWLVFRFATPRHPRFQKWDRLTAISVAFGLFAVALSYGPRPWPLPLSAWSALQIKILKFYPFRLADLLVAVTVALRSVEFWATIRPARGMAGIVTVAYVIAILASAPDQNPSKMPLPQQRDWRAALAWIREKTPPDSLLLAANEDYAVKWFAERPEYVNFKDCPQDAPSIVEWNQRLRGFAKWTTDSFQDDRMFTAKELAALHQQTGIDYLIVSRLGPFETEPVFSQGRFRVYAVQ